MTPTTGIKYVPIRQLLSAVHPRDAQARYLLVIKFCMDCSGKATDVVRVAAGYLATGEQWDAFETEWQWALGEAGVSVFHATDFYNYRGEFERWSPERQAKFAKRFTAICERQLGLGFAMGLEVRPFEEMLAAELRRLPGTPHRRVTSLMYVVMLLLSRVKKMPRLDEPVAIFMEGEEGIGEIIEYFYAMKRDREPWTDAFSSFTTGDKTWLPLQAADLLAHESWRRIKEFLRPSGRKIRKSMQRLLRRERVEMRVASQENMRVDLPKFRRYLTWSGESVSPSATHGAGLGQ